MNLNAQIKSLENLKLSTSGNFNFKMLKTSKVSFKSSSTSTLPYKYFLSLGYRLGSWFMYGLYRDAMATMWNVYGKKLRKEKTLRCEYHFFDTSINSRDKQESGTRTKRIIWWRQREKQHRRKLLRRSFIESKVYVDGETRSIKVGLNFIIKWWCFWYI